MDEEQVERTIKEQGLTAPRVTSEQIDQLMERVVYITEVPAGTTSTFVHAFLDGVFHLATGFSACISPENFNATLGVAIAKPKAAAEARDKLWQLEGYRLFQSERTALPVKPEEVFSDVLQLGEQVYYYERVQDQVSPPMVGTIASVLGQNLVSLSVLAPNGTQHQREAIVVLSPNEEPVLSWVCWARRKP